MDQSVTSIVLNETDRQLISMAARIVMALEPGPTREDAAETIAQAYKDDLSGAHAGTDPEILDGMTVNFGGALLLEMERLGKIDGNEAPGRVRAYRAPNRARVIAALGRYLPMVDPRH